MKTFQIDLAFIFYFKFKIKLKINKYKNVFTKKPYGNLSIDLLLNIDSKNIIIY